MSKQCAICGEKIRIMSECNLSKDYKNIKICFTCYEYVATAMKGNKAAVEKLEARYKDDISSKVSNFVESLGREKNVFEKEVKPRQDEFMKLMGNDLSKVKHNEKSSSKYNIIRLDNLPEAKKDRLIRVKIISTISVFAFLAGGLLLSLYILTQGYGAMLSVVTAIMSIGFAMVFSFIKTILSVILDD